jgi:hypothetical protein
MEEIKAPKKERKFLKAIGNIAKVLANELVMGIGRKFIGKAIDKVGNKRQGLVIAFALVAGISYASIDSIPYPITGNKQRLGFQTTGNGLVWRGTAADTVTKPTSYADKNIKAYLILDSVSGSLYVFKQGAWAAISEGSTIDTVSLSNRINLKVNISDTAAMLLPYFKDSDTSLLNLISRFELKLNISDTASMLLPYATKEYADTTGRLYARQDFTNVSTSTLTWTQTDTLIPGGVTVVQVYRNGQILLPSQYTIPTSTSVVIAATSFKVGDNYTVIFPRGGGAGSGGGSGSLTSISAGTGIVVSPNPITTTGTVSADLTVMMELTDTTLLNLTTRFASKLNTTDTASLSSRIDAKGNGTVTSVATGYGLSGGTITTTGELVLDSAVVFSQIRDSIVDVAIGNDTIKILKQEYAPATTSVLTWTITPKFPIQLKAYILVFRNGQLLINDQYNLTDTNQITIVSNSFKIGANYTVVTVSGIGSVGTGVFPNPVYPDAGIALSTGTTWASSIPNNSTNWNTAFSDRLKWDGGNTGLVAATGRTSLGGTTIGQSMFTLTNPSAITFPRFNADNTVTARTAANFRSDIGAGTVTSVNIASETPMSITNNTTTPEISMAAATGSVNGYLTSTDWTTFNNKQPALGFTPANSTITINTTSPLQGGGDLSNNRTLSILSASDSQSGIVTTTSQLFGGSKVFKNRVTVDSVLTLNTTTAIPNQILGINTVGNVNSVGKFTLGNGLSITSSTLLADTNLLITRYDTASMLTPYLRKADTSLLNLTSRFATKLNISDTSNMLVPYLRKADTTLMLTPYFLDADTSLLNLNSRFALKLNAADTASLSSRIDAKGSGTVTSVASGYGITGGTITTTGTLVLDSAVVFSQIRDSIVDVAIGTDTIKILKQEYAPATTSVLTWTITPKFPIQLKQYILVFRNGQLLINDQYNLTDTNQITIVSNSFKIGSNYTVVTVSGIGSVGTGTFPNPVYPDAGIALSTGSAWASSIPNNSANWNIAFNDKINNAAFTGTNTKTLTLTQYDGGTFTPTFNDLQGVTEVTAGTGLTGGTITSTGTVAVNFGVVAPLASPTFTGTVSGITKSMVGLGNVDNTSDGNKPISTATQTALDLKVNISDTSSMLTPYLRKADTSLLNLTSRFANKLNISDTASMLTNYLQSEVAASTYQTKLNGTGFVKASGTTISYDNSTYLTTGTAASTYLPLTGGTLTGDLYSKYLNTFAKTTYIPFNAGIGEQSIFNVGTTLRGGTVMVFPDSNLVGSSANIFLANSSVQGVESSAMGSGMRNYAKQGSDTRRNSLAFYTSGIGSQNTNRLFIDYDGNVGINDDTPSYKLDVNGTLNATGATTLGSTLAVTGAVTLSTTTATPTSLLGKDDSNVVGTVTTVAQTGLMKAGSVTQNTSSVGIISVAHGLSYEPTQVIVTLAQQNSYIVVCHDITATTLFFTVYDSVTGNPLNNISVGIFWLAIK